MNTVLPAIKQQLSVKIFGFLSLALLVGLSAIGATLYLSWQLEGGAAAINATGSLRMRSYQLAHTLELYAHTQNPRYAEQISAQKQQFSTTLALLHKGDPLRPLYLPNDADTHQLLDQVEADFHNTIERWSTAVVVQKNLTPGGQMQQDFDAIVDKIDLLVVNVERYNQQRTFYLRMSQLLLIALAITGAVSQIYLMLLLIFRPLSRLQDGIDRMAEQELNVRIPVESNDEFGVVSAGFNRMADHLEESYLTLESRVAQKTEQLNEQNRELSLLYDTTSFLNETQEPQALARGFLQRIMSWFNADASSIRVLDPSNATAHLVLDIGLPQSLRDAEQCRHINDCLCGEAVRSNNAAIHTLHFMPEGKLDSLLCEREGFNQVSAFPVRFLNREIGLYTLHFKAEHQFSPQELQLLETLGRHLGGALENIRLAAREREIAIAEERNHMAQGLHDSIAQGLSYLNLQVQMLDDSLAHQQWADARDCVPLLKAGVQESYDDVRELLLNFRSRLGEDNLTVALKNAAAKFERQTGIQVQFDSSGHGAPLPTDDQLQLLFILQEALSNVRKHAAATQVKINFVEGPDLILEITDNGRGFDAAEMAERAESHVGLRIMKERAERIGAQMTYHSDDGARIRIALTRHHESTK